MEQTLPSWLREVDKNLWETLEDLLYTTDRGEVTVPKGFRTDLFTDVPNIDYEFSKAAILHDYLLDRLSSGIAIPNYDKRKYIDTAFYHEMVVQSCLKFQRDEKLLGKGTAIEIFLKMLRISWTYYAGVRSYSWFWKLFT